MKKIISSLLVLSLILSFAGCGNDNYKGQNKNSSATTNESNISDSLVHKSVDNDTNVGLKSIKVSNTHNYKFNETENLLINFFDHDYVNDIDYNAFKRYPDVYTGASVEFFAEVIKIIEDNNGEYTALVSYGYGSRYTEEYVIIKGKFLHDRFIENDQLIIFGVYNGTATYTIDGKTYNCPTFSVNKYGFSWGEGYSLGFNFEDTKSICKYIFGNDISLTKNEKFYGDAQCYTLTFENQSNVNFSEFFVWPDQGEIESANNYIFDNEYGVYGYSDDIHTHTNIIFAADFEHYYVEKFDDSVNTYTIQCYDKNINKIWSREFTETTSIVMDYTPDHIYLVANGSMYILDTQTGENATEPKYVGAKTYIRKVSDGILLIHESASDFIMKTDLLGNVLWTQNVSADYEPESISSIQLIGDNYVLFYKAKTTLNVYGYYDTVSADAVISKDGKLIYNDFAFEA